MTKKSNEIQALMELIKQQQTQIDTLTELVSKKNKKKNKKEKNKKSQEANGMQTVQPFRTLTDIERMRKALLETDFAKRNELLFVLGINTNLRISDLLTLKISDVRKMSHIEIFEKKTGKYRLTLINEEVRSLINDYIQHKPDNEYLFKSRQGGNKPITRQSAEFLLSRAAEQAGITYRVGCHSMRKTWGYHQWKSGTPLAVIQTAFNHTELKTTYKYLGITQQELDSAFGKALYR